MELNESMNLNRHKSVRGLNNCRGELSLSDHTHPTSDPALTDRATEGGDCVEEPPGRSLQNQQDLIYTAAGSKPDSRYNTSTKRIRMVEDLDRESSLSRYFSLVSFKRPWDCFVFDSHVADGISDYS